MKKKILIGSMLVLTLLLLMPSIPAIQQKTIEEGIKQDIREKLDTIALDDLKDIKMLDWIRHPIIYVLLSIYIPIRAESVMKFLEFVVELLPRHIDSPIFVILYQWLYVRLYWFRNILQGIADFRGWNWDLPEVD